MTTNSVSEVQTTQKEPERERRIFTFKATQIVWILLGILEAFLALRFVLKVDRGQPCQPVRGFRLWFHQPLPVPLYWFDGDTFSGRHGA